MAHDACPNDGQLSNSMDLMERLNSLHLVYLFYANPSGRRRALCCCLQDYRVIQFPIEFASISLFLYFTAINSFFRPSHFAIIIIRKSLLSNLHHRSGHSNTKIPWTVTVTKKLIGSWKFIFNTLWWWDFDREMAACVLMVMTVCEIIECVLLLLRI